MKRRAFTLVELMVAVVVLLAVIVATAKIFSTASKVTSMGEASSDVLQQAGAIEEQLRRDFASITTDGYIAIECVAVRNDVNTALNGSAAPLLNPTLPADAIIRADSIVFFKAGGETTMRWSGPNDTVAYGGNQQSRSSRIYYGHGVQLPELANDPANSGSPAKPIVQGVIPNPPGVPQQIVPWTWWNPASATAPQLEWRWGTSNQASAGMPRISPNQPGAREWVLCRKSTLLADDLGSTLYFPDPANAPGNLGPSATPSIFGDRSVTAPTGTDAVWLYLESQGRDFAPTTTNLLPSQMMQSGWVDIASSELAAVHRVISPSFTLTTPLTFINPNTGATVYTINSIVPPWAAQNTAGAPLGMPPLGWPAVGSGAPAFPFASQVTSPNTAGTVALGTAFTSQRDRIIRGTFGPMNSNTLLPTAAYAQVGLLGWPRAEKKLANSDRRSEILLSPVLGSNCSSFQVDWTWDRGTGKQTDAVGAPLSVLDRLGSANTALMRGYEPDAAAWVSGAGDFSRVFRPQPWFGFPDSQITAVKNMAPTPAVPWTTDERLGVTLAQDLTAMPSFAQPGFPANTTNLHMRVIAQGIEGVPNDTVVPTINSPFGAAVPLRVYHAIFGFNQGVAYTVTPDGFRVMRDDYTPWPTQLRFTLTLHDPNLALDRGRDFQFVIDLPKRKK